MPIRKYDTYSGIKLKGYKFKRSLRSGGTIPYHPTKFKPEPAPNFHTKLT